MMDDQELTQKTAVFKALSEPNRLRIFAELMAGDSCNCELKEKLALAPNLLSHHLKVLEAAGLVNSRRDVIDGRWIYYSINREHISQWHGWVNAFFDPAHIQQRPLAGRPRDLLSSADLQKSSPN